MASRPGKMRSRQIWVPLEESTALVSWADAPVRSAICFPWNELPGTNRHRDAQTAHTGNDGAIHEGQSGNNAGAGKAGIPGSSPSIALRDAKQVVHRGPVSGLAKGPRSGRS